MKLYEIADDSGFMGLFNPERYSSFVDEDWDLKRLLNHFMKQIQSNNLLFWSTGTEGTWTVSINKEITSVTGFREIEGVIEVTNGKLCLINYESLTMGAQFEDVVLPERHLEDCSFEINNGVYKTRIIQMFNPEIYSDNAKVHFILEFEQTNVSKSNWGKIPWLDHY
ncbi:hypothetical protein [Paenibacillus sp. sgz500958]|uniref:hypothetical protein n=1 Tax=Paenibacillus sp. sgz500958 TaxID=3242475 RepID=UPI0036D3B617